MHATLCVCFTTFIEINFSTHPLVRLQVTLARSTDHHSLCSQWRYRAIQWSLFFWL